MYESCKDCKGYGMVRKSFSCDCGSVCFFCENKDKTGYVECGKCISTGNIKKVINSFEKKEKQH